MTEANTDRLTILSDMDGARSALRALLASATPSDLRRLSAGTRWTNEQLLYHMVFGFMVVQALMVLVRLFGRLPGWAGRCFAGALNAGARPFHVVNYWGSRLGATVYSHRRMAAKLDKVVDTLQRRLLRELDTDLQRSMSFPTRWDPFFKPTMTLADVYRYPVPHVGPAGFDHPGLDSAAAPGHQGLHSVPRYGFTVRV